MNSIERDDSESISVREQLNTMYVLLHTQCAEKLQAIAIAIILSLFYTL